MAVPAPDLLALGVEVAKHRRALGCSIDYLAEAAGVHRKTIIQIEAGRVSARVGTLHAIAHALNVPLAQLLDPLCRQHEGSLS
ncbi:helix-turn-helix domain-containing protein [Leucobacter aridicollis]|uniref:helix-turn-helix domain-containing protein n=1 Tax=Leucobacter aridicollis TaxID=283878 RepID=UPI000E64F787|nr:helix-turn-helix transcriptional regulator [Leucobacter aridicollis]UTX54332.1 helix-turn-helix transcriptional regulator [Leucobacter aridicollis]